MRFVRSLSSSFVHHEIGSEQSIELLASSLSPLDYAERPPFRFEFEVHVLRITRFVDAFMASFANKTTKKLDSNTRGSGTNFKSG